MIYLCEREIGFDAAEIGFPSVMGCRAIVLVTGGGLFGYHLNGALNPGKQAAFVAFVNGHVQGATGKRMLYAASAGAGMPVDHQEIRSIATALGYGGPIYWAALATAGSLYVHYMDINHNTCGITARTWNDGTDNVGPNKAPYLVGPDRAIANGAPNANMFTNVSTAGLQAVYPTQI
ncbi:MAG TPA: hypothetical protein VFK29_06115 [Rhodanobacteraceae bacterium]|nr:hypothetical protein [Rhodanobacteraceae bacterium]